ncbi:MAG: vitamin B12-dependent ribonucleotide reductase, partial [Acidimicrobiia bacterium]
NSIVDYVFRALGMEYLGRTDLVQVPPTEARALPEPPKGIATQTGQQLGLQEAKMEDDIDAQSRAAAFVDAEVVDITDSSPTAAASTPLATPTVKPASPNSSNGTSAGATNGQPAAQATAVIASTDAQTSSVQAALASNMGDAPLCDTCGHITVRNGSCYRCMNCGDSKGCS